MLDTGEVGHLIADVGGTHTRFGLSSSSDALLECVHVFMCADFERFEDVIEAYMQVLSDEKHLIPTHACIAVAAPAHKNEIRLTNNSWSINKSELASRFDLSLLFINDFSAQAHCLDVLRATDLKEWQQPLRDESNDHNFTRTVVGPGTGFGMSVLTENGDVLESEAGHCSFAPVTPHELALLQCLWELFPRVSAEHLLSGAGLTNLYYANSRLQGSPIGARPLQPEIGPEQVVRMARDGNQMAQRTLDDFFAILGSVCGDIALSTGCLGGFYLSGAMLEKMCDLIEVEYFLERFRDKGPFSEWCRDVPIARICHPYPGLLGCSAFARWHWPIDAKDMSMSGLRHEL
jgi:glucokinase